MIRKKFLAAFLSAALIASNGTAVLADSSDAEVNVVETADETVESPAETEQDIDCDSDSQTDCTQENGQAEQTVLSDDAAETSISGDETETLFDDGTSVEENTSAAGDASTDGDTSADSDTSADTTDGVAITTDNFGDEALRELLEPYDYNGDNVLSENEIKEIRTINLRDRSDLGIYGLDGIEYLTELESLDVGNTPLVTMDLSKNTKLKKLICSETAIKGLNLNKNTELTTLDVSLCTKLQQLDCSGGKLTSLNASGCSLLKTLRCADNQLTELNLSGCSFLQYVCCNNNQLTDLDLTATFRLQSVDCQNNQLTSISLYPTVNMDYLDCNDNKLTSLDLSEISNLNQLHCERNGMVSLKLGSCEKVYCSNNNLTSLEPGGCDFLYANNNQLTSLTLPDFAVLKVLECTDNQLTELNINGCTSLLSLKCQNNKLKELDLTTASLLNYLDCSHNELTVLNLGGLAKLTDVNATYNHLTSLDLTASAEAATSTQCMEADTRYNEYDITIDSNRSFDLKDLPGNFDISRTSGWSGGTVSGTVLTVYEDADKVSYYYDYFGENKEYAFQSGMEFDLNVKIPEHEHVYSLQRYDETGHWSKCWCGAVTETEAHSGAAATETEDQICTVCGYKMADKTGLPIAREFPDPVFQSKVSIYDGDKDGYLSDAELENLARVAQLIFTYSDLASLKGIEYFTGLEKLTCTGCKLTELDLSRNTKLVELDCSGNSLTELDLGQNTELVTLDCSYNQLTSLNVSKSAGLETLKCGYNQLTALDVSANTELVTLDCDDNENLKNLDVSRNTKLESLRCQSTGLKSLDVSGNPALKELECRYNEISSLDVSRNTKLEALYCSKNPLTSLDLSSNVSLTTLWCSSMQLVCLDLGNNTELSDFEGGSSQFTIQAGKGNTFDLSNLAAAGFDPARVTEWLVGATVSGTVLHLTNESVLYTYDCGGGHTATFELLVTGLSADTDSGDGNNGDTGNTDGGKGTENTDGNGDTGNTDGGKGTENTDGNDGTGNTNGSGTGDNGGSGTGAGSGTTGTEDKGSGGSSADQVTNVKLSVSKLKLTIGKSKKLTLSGAWGTVSWKSSSSSVASVSRTGIVKAKKAGKAVIYATVNGKTLKCVVTCVPVQQKISSLKKTSSGKALIQWKRDKKASGYQIRYSTDKNFKKNVKIITVKNSKTLKKTITKLKKGKTWYFQVRSYSQTKGVKYYGAYSSRKKVRI